MTHEQLIQKCQEIAIRASLNAKELEAKLKANNGPAQRADIFWLPGMDDDCPLWGFAVTHYHPDNKGYLLDPKEDDLLFVVPIDTMTSLVGVADVEEQDNEYLGHIVARCGNGAWVSRKFLDSGKRVGELNPGSGEMCDQCQQKVAALARGTVEATNPIQQWASYHPDYEEWIEEVSGWVWFITGE